MMAFDWTSYLFGYESGLKQAAEKNGQEYDQDAGQDPDEESVNGSDQEQT